MAAQKQTSHPAVHQVIEDACVWRRSGAVASVKHDFQTHGPGPSPARLRMLVKDLRCHHMPGGQVAYKLCAHGFDCVRCSFDQMLEDSGMLPTPAAPMPDPVSGFAVARGYSHH